ncbi:unnamed protein product [Blepharisma stoltei]|uniref:Uncharacterized protein n=1 Tax=Blepharisma stoltei TaxID=1481888 RepID=A0AAU9JC35_9CILI|nr:unnamed protein product [Blepharisma stoltei]
MILFNNKAKMEPQPKNRWVMSDSEEEEEEVKPQDEHIITSLPTLEDAKAPKPKKKKKSKSKPKEEEEKVDPNLTTKIVAEQKVEAKNLRPDGTTASKKEVQKKELDELDSILQEFGLQPQDKTAEQQAHEEDNKQNQQKGKAKSSKKEVFESVRAEINARNTKKSKKKDKMNYPR